MHGKISATMYTGSMVGAGAMAFALMPYCIANARPDENCSVDLNPQVLAAVFGESKKVIQSAIAYLSSPDPLSRSRDCDGRRLVHVGPGPFRYRVVNLQKYRDDAISDERREYWRQHKVWERAGKIGDFKFVAPNPMSTIVNDSKSTNDCGQIPVHCGSPQSVHTTEAEAGTGAVAFSLPHTSGEFAERPSLEEVKTHAQFIGLVEWKAVDWFNEMESCGWVDNKGRRVDKWKPMLARVRMFWEADGRPTAPRSFKQPQTPQQDKPNGAQTVVLNDELRRVEAKIKALRDSYSDHQDWSEKDRATLRQLNDLMKQIRKQLGLSP